MATKTNRDKPTSLCEKSTRIAINIVRVSSLCIARLTLGTIGDRGSHARGVRAMAAPSLMLPDGAPMRSVEPEIHPRSSYLMEPPTAAATAAEGEDGDGVDWRAEDYIKRFRERNKSNANVLAEIPRSFGR
ncbi:hypothetical protein J5N97_007928 [Dioscorea zingiberensis]|uniref:Uncharacterized protein n=1 Tax=Dioscorea zingiberensis TaxID=325984 RepID=A0A9D5DHR4_9LILI|nr:hypothetical protein J5N97_007928 [Dioscorea zingiberensis]